MELFPPGVSQPNKGTNKHIAIALRLRCNLSLAITPPSTAPFSASTFKCTGLDSLPHHIE